MHFVAGRPGHLIHVSKPTCLLTLGKRFPRRLPSGMGHPRVPSVADGETFLLNMIPAQIHALADFFFPLFTITIFNNND